MIESRWEYGSDFHDVSTAWSGENRLAAPWDDLPSSFWSVGRAPVASVVQRLGGRLFVPEYFCDDVVATWMTAGLQVERYDDGPHRAGKTVQIPNLKPGDVVLACGYFGVRPVPTVLREEGAGATIIEDHTHDPWADRAYESSADFCVASLRKTLPVPDGAVLWSPSKQEVPQPSETSPERGLAIYHRLSAMLLKSRYLVGELISKPAFRQSAVKGEDLLGSVDPSAMSPYSAGCLAAFPTRSWRESRRINWDVLARKTERCGGFSLLRPESKDVPFSFVLRFANPKQRDDVRQRLAERKVYTAVLWDVRGNRDVSPDAVAYSESMLSIPCDGRYNREHLERVADLLVHCVEAC